MSPEANNKPAAEPENYPLDEEVITLLGEINSEITKLNARAQGVLVLFIRQHKLPGEWRVAENGRELVKLPQPQPGPMMMRPQ